MKMSRGAHPKLAVYLLVMFAVSIMPRASKAAEKAADRPGLRDQIDWPAFMARHDLVWDTLPSNWREGAFLGNGLLGLMIYQPSKPFPGRMFGWAYRPDEANSLRLDLGRSDVIDHRRGKNTLVDRARLPIGHFLLTPVGTISGGVMRLDLLAAEARGTLTTDRGTIQWRAFVPAEEDVMVFEYRPSEGERGCTWDYVAAISESPRVYRGYGGPTGRDRPQDKIPANPPAERSTKDPYSLSRQPMLAGGDYTTAWRTHETGDIHRVFIAIGYDPQGTSVPQAIDTLRTVAEIDFAVVERDHRRWWGDYLAQSFLSIPDSRMESFYWIQMYKLGSATRADKPAIDLMGPWYHHTIWPGMWWNLNIQLTYYPVYTSNRLNIGASLPRMIDDNTRALVQNAPKGKHDAGAFKGIDFTTFAGEMARVARMTASGDLAGGDFKGQADTVEMGNLPWALHNYWRHCRYAADDERMRATMLPMLRRAINFYRPILERDDKGIYHLRPTYSPELGYGPDCNYDVAILRWGLRTLIAESARLGIDDPLMSEWKDIHANLTDYPTDDNGFMLARGVPFKGNHRHYSHLLMIYPLSLVTWDQHDKRDLILRSVKHWSDKRGAFAGYSYSGAASMYASIRDGDEAASFIDQMIDRTLEPNTMYLEAESPVIESPLSGAQSVNDMLLQSWSTWVDDTKAPQLVSTIRVFPAVPDAWADATFADLLTENAFLVSAARSGGATQWVRVESRAGKPCRIQPNLPGEARALDPAHQQKIRPVGDGVYELDLERGEKITLYAGKPPANSQAQPVPGNADQFNFFGSRASAAHPRNQPKRTTR
jgi:hypothetical protein